MISDLLLWNKIGRIIVLLGERLNVSSERALGISTSLTLVNGCMIPKRGSI
mgnify:CR=1 FL=1